MLSALRLRNHHLLYLLHLLNLYPIYFCKAELRSQFIPVYPNILPYKQVVLAGLAVSVKLGVPDRLEVGDDVGPGAGVELARQVGLHTQAPDVNILPRKALLSSVSKILSFPAFTKAHLQDGQLGALDIQTEVVDGGVAQGQQQGVERQAL